ncbi:MAG: EAL domain-containing protein [Clostridia bacterium]|nr:EAL domain-containing protein [Clostridia bacterium]
MIPVSLNFSRLDFELMDAVGELEALTARYALPKELIHVEVTESALADDSMKLDEALNRVKRSGYALWLDDFGSGYSSLNVLKDYEFDMVKIDMRFLQNLENSEKAKTLLKCVVELADQIHMQTLTEGVETEAQARFLKEIGCSRLQGYLFGRPVPRDALYDRIARGELILHSSISDHA